LRGCKFAETFESSAKVALNNGTISGTPTIAFGATFDGVSDYIDYPIFPNTQTISISCKLSLASKTGGVGTNMGVVGVWNSATSLFAYMLRYNKTTSRLEFVIYDGGVQTAQSDADLTIGQEYSVMATYDGTTLKLYVDGVLQATTDTATGITYPTASVVFQIGRYYSNDNSWHGTVKDLKIFNEALTAQEAADYYNDENYNYMDSAVVHLPMTAAYHDPTNVRTLDATANGNNATFGDGSTSSTYPTKLSKRGYSFDGGTDYLTLGDISASTWAAAFLIKVDSSTASYNRIMGQASFQIDIAIGTTDTLAVYDGGWKTCTEPFHLGLYSSAIITYDGTSLIMYQNGIQCYSATAGRALSGATKIGSSDAAGDNIDADILEAAIISKPLTPLQVADLHVRMMRQVNNV
jgi:hypothetical protein